MLLLVLVLVLLIVANCYVIKSSSIATYSSKLSSKITPIISSSSSSLRKNIQMLTDHNSHSNNIDSYVDATMKSSPPPLLASSLELSPFLLLTASILSVTLFTTTMFPSMTLAIDNVFDPSQFQPVCPSSDTFYQVLKYVANALVGQENVVEYGPLIASVLLRIRLELCVLESFVYEAVIPFIQQKGISWVLPVHETVETFLAGTIFALASNFILLGSTKIISIVTIYLDVLTGFPSRLLGKGLKNSGAKPIGYFFEAYGTIVGTLRNVLVKIDSFVGSYLVIATTGYIAFKFLHFKLFNGLPDFGLPELPSLSLPDLKLPDIKLSDDIQNLDNLNSRLRDELPNY